MKKIVFASSLIFLCFAFVFSQEQKSEEIRLTLNDCLLKALENNFDIRVEAFTPEISEFSIRQSREVFMPQLNLEYVNTNYKSLSNWFVQGTYFEQKTSDYSIGLSQKIVIGGDISLSLRNSITDTTRSLTIVNPSYSGNLSLNLNQPLLKGFGPKINRRDIKIAQNDRDISVYNLKSTLIRKVYEVEEAYWGLVLAIESLRVNEYSLSHSKEQLEKTKEAARIGIKTAIDVLASETEVAKWESMIISTKSQLEKAEDGLRKIINLPADDSGRAMSIVPVDKPIVEKKEITFEEALKIALEQRPEMAKSQKEIEKSILDVSYYKNQLLPQFDLRFQLWYPGQSGDVLIYENGDPLRGKLIGKIEGSRMDAFKDVFKFRYNNWVLTLNLGIPLQNFLSRASLAKARMEKEQKLLEMERDKKSIYDEISEVFKDLKNNEKKMEASSLVRELTEKKVAAEEERVRLGLVTSEWLFQYQRELASAKSDEIRAIIDYKVSVANLERLMGINLKTKNLKFRNY